jgi:cation:H+ antiporter
LNIFNGLFIVGTAATIHPIAVAPASVAIALGFGIAAMLCSFPDGMGWMDRRRGILLVVLYVAYVIAVLLGADS